jgi:uncharacterized membrane-anchored protein YhcB (DUF1043 family)
MLAEVAINRIIMTIKDVILKEIEKTQKELDKLKKQLESNQDYYNKANANQMCPKCNTKNYHYSVKSNSFNCAFCD